MKDYKVWTTKLTVAVIICILLFFLLIWVVFTEPAVITRVFGAGNEYLILAIFGGAFILVSLLALDNDNPTKNK